MSRPAAAREERSRRSIATNRRARHEYDILEKVEAGLVLQGTEVKSLREGKVNLKDAYAAFEGGEAWLVACHISEYIAGSWTNHEPERRRKLLLHRREIDRLASKVQEKGLTVVPLEVYFLGQHVKVELGLARGRQLHDKRRAIRDREVERETRAAIKSRMG